MNDKAMKKYNALIEDLVSLAKESHDSRESIVCTEASGWLRHLFDKSERLSMDLKHTEEVAASAKSEKFSLQSFILANLIQPNQQVILYEYTGVQEMRQSWLGQFCGIPDSYVHRTVDKVFVPAYPAMMPFNSTLYILLTPET